MTKYLFLDTNVFLQCRSLAELPWGEATDDTEIVLLVPTVVEQELDQHKNLGNARRARRARKASALFSKATPAKNETLVIRGRGPRVTLTFPPPIHSTASLHPALAPDSPDDQIVAEALRCEEYGADRIVVSHDSRPLRSAKRVGLDYFVVPDVWLLPAEAEERDKKIESLEAEVAWLRSTLPEIKLTIEADGQVIDRKQELAIEVTRIHSLDQGQIEALVEAQRSANPMKEIYGIPITSDDVHAVANQRFFWQSITREPLPSQAQLDSYRNEEYPAYLTETRRFYEQLHTELERRSRHHKLLITLENTGYASAEDLLVEIEAHGGLVLKESYNLPALRPPDPPSPPMAPTAGGMLRLDIGRRPLDRLEAVLFDDESKRREPRTFYWEEGLRIGPASRCSLVCQEFRHKTNYQIALSVYVPPDKEFMERCAINVSISARNLPEPIRKVVGLRVTERWTNVTDVADSAIL